jgi:ubiquitin-protein ligase
MCTIIMCFRNARLDAEIANFATTFANDGIEYFHNNDTGYGLIRGADDTPYEGGFYIIKFEFPSEYPFKPPACSHITMSELRQSPNFHDNKGSTEGTVCLSRLNTWDGDNEGKDRWTSSLGIEYILRMIQAQVLTIDPLDNEPNYRHTIEFPTAAKNYENFVIYQNYRSNVVDIYQRLKLSDTNIPCGIEQLIMSRIFEYVTKNRDKYVDALGKLIKHHGMCYNCSTYNNSFCFCDYESVIEEFNNTYGNGNKIKIKLKIKKD